LRKHLEEGESFDGLINEILNVYEEHKGKNVEQSTRQISNVIKELSALQDGLVDAVNGLRKTYDDEIVWTKEFGIKTFAQALEFDWAEAQSIYLGRMIFESGNSELVVLRLKWIELILDIIKKIKRLTAIIGEHEANQI
jgi:hypothetical protein